MADDQLSVMVRVSQAIRHAVGDVHMREIPDEDLRAAANVTAAYAADYQAELTRRGLGRLDS